MRNHGVRFPGLRVLFSLAGLWFAGLGTLCLGTPSAYAVGEAVNGFPNWEERVIHEWANRARADPQVEMQSCGAACGDRACYQPIAPLSYSLKLNRAARFHSDEQRLQGYFAHDSACTVVSNIDALYPGTCSGVASCACVGGAKQCSPTCTTFAPRVALFGSSPSGEIIASSKDPNSAFYQWLFESFSGTQCMYVQGPPTNGHRWNLLKLTGALGVGVTGPAVGDFGGGGPATQLPSGSHYPRQASAIEMWASWYDSAGPKSAQVSIDGTCQTLKRARGSDLNGAWTATVTGLGSGCHRYYFVFTDQSNKLVLYPTNGSLAIGPAMTASCPDYDSSRPASGAGSGCSATVPAQGGSGPGLDGGVGGADASSDFAAGPGDSAAGTVGPATGCACQLGTQRGGAGGPALLALLLAVFALFRHRRYASQRQLADAVPRQPD